MSENITPQPGASSRISFMAMFTAFAIVLSYVESFIPMVALPGVKLGLANLAIILALYLLGAKQAFIINIIRVLVVGFLFGSLFSIAYSLSGALFSLLVMIIAKRTRKLDMPVIGVLGGISHNIAQLAMAAVLLRTQGVFYYFPILFLGGLVAGLLIGIVAAVIYSRTSSIYFNK